MWDGNEREGTMLGILMDDNDDGLHLLVTLTTPPSLSHPTAVPYRCHYHDNYNTNSEYYLFVTVVFL